MSFSGHKPYEIPQMLGTADSVLHDVLSFDAGKLVIEF